MDEKSAYGTDKNAPYTCQRVSTPIRVDGNLDKAVWKEAVCLPSFADKTSGRRALFETRASMLWDDTALYVSFRMEDRDVWSTREAPVTRSWMENTVQVSIAGPGAHYELMVNALGETYEIFYIWKDAYQRGGRYDIPEFDLAVHRPLVLGGDAGLDSRGMRWVFFHWNYPGLQTGVRVNGTLEDRRDIDTGWTVELALPWDGITRLMDGNVPPRVGDRWEIGLSRNQIIDQRASFYQAVWLPYPVGDQDARHPTCIPEVVFG
jgi:hypothetical protein